MSHHIAQLSNETGQDVVRCRIGDLPSHLKSKVQVVVTFGNYEDTVSEQDAAALTGLCWVQSMSSGVEDLPLKSLRDRQIIITSARGVQAGPIAEYVVGMLLYFAKRLSYFQMMQNARVWDAQTDTGEIDGKVLGVLGTGSIGQAIARRAAAFGMTLIGVNQNGHPVPGFERVYAVDDVQTMLAMCDYICAALPSTAQTRGLIGPQSIAAMKDGAYFINVGRGDLVLDDALVDAIRSGKLGGAALDVFNDEPLPVHHPFWSLESVILTPHVASRTADYIPRVLDLFLANFRCFQDGRYEDMMNLV